MTTELSSGDEQGWPMIRSRVSESLNISIDPCGCAGGGGECIGRSESHKKCQVAGNGGIGPFR
ncbi:MAG: hypothetical protein EA381_08610 [Planctomycetaceae bacterium]|nr:MAG: hypothetical protein EA381_08610 [Planctomycetaceae bacterium]